MSELLPMLKFDLRVVAGAQGGVMVLIVLVAGGLAAFGGSASVATPMVVVLALFLGLSLFTSDETYRLRHLHGTLPVARRTVLTSHYAVGAGALVLLMAVGLFAALLGTVVSGEPVESTVTGSLLVLGVVLLAYAVQVPLIVRFGATQGRFALLAVMAVVIAVAMLAVGAADAVDIEVPAFLASPALPWLVVGVGLVALVPSWWASVLLYERQDH